MTDIGEKGPDSDASENTLSDYQENSTAINPAPTEGFNMYDIEIFLAQINDSKSKLYESLGRMHAQVDQIRDFLEAQRKLTFLTKKPENQDS